MVNLIRINGKQALTDGMVSNLAAQVRLPNKSNLTKPWSINWESEYLFSMMEKPRTRAFESHQTQLGCQCRKTELVDWQISGEVIEKESQKEPEHMKIENRPNTERWSPGQQLNTQMKYVSVHTSLPISMLPALQHNLMASCTASTSTNLNSIHNTFFYKRFIWFFLYFTKKLKHTKHKKRPLGRVVGSSGTLSKKYREKMEMLFRLMPRPRGLKGLKNIGPHIIQVGNKEATLPGIQ